MHGHREARGRLGRSHRKNTTMRAADANVGNWRKIRILLGIHRPTLSGERLAKPVKVAYVLPGAAVGGTERFLGRKVTLVHNGIDWLGGYPIEIARPEEIFNHYRRHGFRLEMLVTCQGSWANNEYVFLAPDADVRCCA